MKLQAQELSRERVLIQVFPDRNNQVLEEYQRIIYAIEIQDQGLEGQKELNKQLVELAKEFPILANNHECIRLDDRFLRKSECDRFRKLPSGDVDGLRVCVDKLDVFEFAEIVW